MRRIPVQTTCNPPWHRTPRHTHFVSRRRTDSNAPPRHGTRKHSTRAKPLKPHHSTPTAGTSFRPNTDDLSRTHSLSHSVCSFNVRTHAQTAKNTHTYVRRRSSRGRHSTETVEVRRRTTTRSKSNNTTQPSSYTLTHTHTIAATKDARQRPEARPTHQQTSTQTAQQQRHTDTHQQARDTAHR